MEWGNFWSSHLPRTSYDIDLDADSPNPNDQVRLGFCRASFLIQLFLEQIFGSTICDGG